MDETTRRLTAEFARIHEYVEDNGYLHTSDIWAVDALNAYIAARVGPRVPEWRPIEGTFLL